VLISTVTTMAIWLLVPLIHIERIEARPLHTHRRLSDSLSAE